MTMPPTNESVELALQANSIFTMETKYELFNEMLGILKLCYTVTQISPSKVTVKPLESEKFILLEWNNGVITVTADHDKMWAFALEDKLSVGFRVLDIENIMVQEFRLSHEPIALTSYLYYRLLGLLWGTRTSQQLREQDPVPKQHAYIELYGPTQDGKELMYVYRADAAGAIWVEKYLEKTIKLNYIVIYPKRYLDDPVQTVENFFTFFKDIVCITKACRG